MANTRIISVVDDERTEQSCPSVVSFKIEQQGHPSNFTVGVVEDYMELLLGSKATRLKLTWAQIELLSKYYGETGEFLEAALQSKQCVSNLNRLLARRALYEAKSNFSQKEDVNDDDA